MFQLDLAITEVIDSQRHTATAYLTPLDDIIMVNEAISLGTFDGD